MKYLVVFKEREMKINIILLSLLVCFDSSFLFVMDDSVARLLNMLADDSRRSVVMMGNSRTVIEPKDADGNTVTEIYTIHHDRPLITTETIRSNGRREFYMTHPETLTQRIVQSSDGSKQVTMYDENMNSTMQKFDRHGNLIE